MAIQKTEAFILRTRPFRTSSLLITCFSRSFGKIKGIVKGVRREGGVRPGSFEPFTLVEIVFYEKIHSEIHLISEVSSLETFEGLRREIEVLATAYYVVELVDEFTESRDPHEAIFELLHLVFRLLPELSPPFVTRFFEIQLLQETGLLPHLSGCLVCGAKDLERLYFSARQGGILCVQCRKKFSEARPLDHDVFEAMRRFQERRIDEALSFPLEERTEQGVREVVEGFLMEKLGRPLATRRFLNQVRSVKLHSASRRSLR